MTIILAAAMLVTIGLVGLFVSYRGRSGFDADLPRQFAPVGMPLAAVPHVAASPRSGAVLIGNREKHRYHRADCPSVPAMSERNRVVLQSPENARTQGFEPCEKCRPPVAENGPPRQSSKPG